MKLATAFTLMLGMAFCLATDRADASGESDGLRASSPVAYIFPCLSSRCKNVIGAEADIHFVG
ncbi:hypothetical protein JR064_13740 [Xanthomonas sp. CFBP 8703]|jgi:hypothetical protein|uniref:Uncharacterized protein n=1 Tax=Xanthomonas bonasiae TaxID=2810351 RepID=A0ABS3B3V3_9XANT|nr:MULTISPECIES: hypothetical protein [Xanthomonas]MBD7922211.1 hypothetical protein [Xanthomonas surreyensis]MBN6103222.1 hypothetical protein [Xanthomonas bonasiae]MBN6110232.1 hypothetical protein [Xanthomonas bonasiae]